MRVSSVTVRRRILIALLVGVILYSLLIIRLGYVQLVQGQWLKEHAEELWSRDLPFEPKRGKILDRNGEVLAYNISVPSVMAVPAQIQDPAATAKNLAPILERSQEDIYKKITERQLMVRVPGGRKISDEKARQIMKLNLPGILIMEDSKRYYPRGAFASHVLGFTGIDNQGLTGIEMVYDDKLKGQRGYISFYAEAGGERMPGQPEQFQPPRDGLNLELTLDVNIQAVLERELDQVELVYQPDDALAIAMDPDSGAILGMASRPDFDPMHYQDYPSEVYNRNLPIWKTYEPGSTFKIITLAAALEENKVDLERDHFHDPGFIKVAGANIRCWKRGGHGSQSYLEVVENSCNPGFVSLGQKLGKEELFDYIHQFGFGQKTGIDLIGEENGVLFKLNRVGPVELATTSFGQGVSVTPIQQITAVSAAINGGKLYRPYLAKKWVSPVTGETVEVREPEVVRQVISPETSEKVRYALESVVARGTGRNAYIDGYRVGGKTGTAQVVENGAYSRSKHIVSFIGFAPADDPEIVVYVAVNNPKGTVQFGGTVAAPVVQNILESSLRYLDVKPRDNQIPKEYRYGMDKKWMTIPDLTGMNVQELQRKHYTFPIQVSGKGKYVIHQAPEPGTRVEEGVTIRLYLGDQPGDKLQKGD
ncbi:MAG: stage V sporulation protein D [Bacillaceae bacterium]|nr:stage V sporulation protein D [Bacillaceae bacterium]